MPAARPRGKPLDALHPESLLRVPLVSRAFQDVKIVPQARAVDCRWRYAGHIKPSLTGFNPFFGSFFFGARSHIATWRNAPEASARPHNTGDRLVKEVLFGVHDFLHAWAYGRIRELRPALELGHGPIRERNAEALLFAHLLTEAVAVVGLDYWCLSTLDLNDLCPIGTTLTALTADYHERHLPEYRRARPHLQVQAPEFFSELATFYCTGSFLGFEARDLSESPRLERWLRHEVTYAGKQRRYFRQWLGSLAGRAVAAKGADRPLAADAPWQRRLAADLGASLWDLVKNGGAPRIAILARADAWARPASGPINPRFVNLNALDDDELERCAKESDGDGDAFDWLLDQYLSRFDYGAFDRNLLPLLPTLRARRAWRAVKGQQRLDIGPDEPRDPLVVS